MIEFFAMQPLSIEDPRVLDVLRGCRARLRGQKELNTTRAPWTGTANALMRASAFNEGVRVGNKAIEAFNHAASKGRCVLKLNDDVFVVDGDAIARTMAHLDSEQRLGEDE